MSKSKFGNQPHETRLSKEAAPLLSRMGRILGFNAEGLLKSALSFGIFWIRGGCCGEEIEMLDSCRYDVERLGCFWTDQPENSDVLLLSGGFSEKAISEIQKVMSRLPSPSWIVVVGACATQMDWEKHGIVVDVFIPACPPRPEAVMHGLLTLKDRVAQENLGGSLK